MALTTVQVGMGGTGTASPSLVGGTNITISGSWPNQTVTAAGGAPTTDQVLSATAGATAGAVGTYAMAMTTSGTTNPGSTVAGSSLRGRNVAAGDGSYNPSYSGTWRCMGAGQSGDNSNQFNNGLWLRIS